MNASCCAAALSLIPTFSSRRSASNYPPRPCWDGSAIVPLPVALRVYLIANGDSYTVMRGGLARVFPGAEGHSISLQRGGSSKDTWVPSETPVDGTTLLLRRHAELWNCAALEIIFPRASRIIFSGSAVIPNAPMPRRASCAAPCNVSARSAPPAPHPCSAPLLQTLHTQGQIARHPGKTRAAAKSRSLRSRIARRDFRSRSPRQLARQRRALVSPRDARPRPHLARHVACAEPASSRFDVAHGRPSFSRATPPEC